MNVTAPTSTQSAIRRNIKQIQYLRMPHLERNDLNMTYHGAQNK
ncbi:hypothetical protein T01_9178 [Trichinella spiralis]|uniref:Uncharacterized protein n=1 Tax=Trichinella spiralis TaxID=6334 RepID=A0A0V1AHU8_TRISP|nr:hypothetical protein T01_9178 [Trichinella spiralis]